MPRTPAGTRSTPAPILAVFKPQLIAQMSAVASDGTSYVAMDGSNRVATTWDVSDMDALQAAQSATSPEMAAAMERYGMIPPMTVYIEKWLAGVVRTGAGQRRGR